MISKGFHTHNRRFCKDTFTTFVIQYWLTVPKNKIKGSAENAFFYMGLAKLHDEEPLNSGVINILPNEAKYNSGSNW